MFVFPFSFELRRRWQFRGYALIPLLEDHFKISFVEASDDSNAAL